MNIRMSEKEMEKIPYLYGAFFALANRMQILGDNFYDRISSKQWLLLAVISKFENEEPTLGQLAAIIGTSRQNVKKMALILEREGFLVLKKDDKDARMIRVSRTKECEAYDKEYSERAKEYLNELFEGISCETITAMYEGMKQLEENLIKMESRKETT